MSNLCLNRKIFANRAWRCRHYKRVETQSRSDVVVIYDFEWDKHKCTKRWQCRISYRDLLPLAFWSAVSITSCGICFLQAIQILFGTSGSLHMLISRSFLTISPRLSDQKTSCLCFVSGVRKVAPSLATKRQDTKCILVVFCERLLTKRNPDLFKWLFRSS